METTNDNNQQELNGYSEEETASQYTTSQSSSTLLKEPNLDSADPVNSEDSSYPLDVISKHPRRKRILLSTLGVGAIAISLFGLHWWQYASTHEETDDAYVAANIHPINTRILGTVTQVLVNDNQVVQQGELLVKLDPRDYANALQQAQAALAAAQQQSLVAQANIGVVATNAQGQTTQAQGDIGAATAAIATAQAQVLQAQTGVPDAQANLAQVNANLVKAQADYQRYQMLVQQGAIPQQQFDAAKAAYAATLAERNAASDQVQQAKDQVVQAQQNLTSAQAKLAATRGGLQEAQATSQQTQVQQRQYQATLAAVTQAQAQVNNAQLQLSYTNITAPVSGQIGNKTLQVGQQVQPGQTLMSVVQLQPWIVANFKETQLDNMHPGQTVQITLDAFPNHPFTGKVDSVSPASGSDFALLPPDNATGNFTKIVQRIPVKIVFDPSSIQGYESRITPGMSVDVTVTTR